MGRGEFVASSIVVITTTGGAGCVWLCGFDRTACWRLEARHGRRRVHRGAARRISRLTDATALHQHVILAGQGHRTKGNHEEQIRHVGLRAFAVNHVAFLRSETTDRWERLLAGFVHRAGALFTSRMAPLCSTQGYASVADIICHNRVESILIDSFSFCQIGVGSERVRERGMDM